MKAKLMKYHSSLQCITNTLYDMQRLQHFYLCAYVSKLLHVLISYIHFNLLSSRHSQ